MADKVRIGIIGAGGFTQSRILPGFKAVEGCEVVMVANRRKETAEAVAAKFEIPALITICAGWAGAPSW